MQPGLIITSPDTKNTYTIGDKIGEGFFSVVYEAKDGWENELAVKVLKPRGTYETLRDSAIAEVQRLLQLRSPFITFVHDAFEFQGAFCIVTERCHSPLSFLFQFEDLKGAVWLMPIARCLLQAVHYLHLNNFVHQDIHAGNVFTHLVKDEMVKDRPQAWMFKLGDLGVAQLIPEVTLDNPRMKGILPPEVLNTSEFGAIDHRIDIYHVGLLFLQLLHCKPLHFSDEERLAGKPREMALALDPPYNFALEKALRRHVQYRTDTAMELWRDLHTPPSA